MAINDQEPKKVSTQEISSIVTKPYNEIIEKQAKEIFSLNLEVIKQKTLTEGIQSEKIEKGTESLKKFGYRELKEKLESLLKRDECNQNETVASTKIAKWVREITNDGYTTSENIIRAKLSDMGYTSERPTESQ
jgi:hypothetical protein